MNRLKVAVVGVGALGRHHARILSELDSVELVAVADTNLQRGAQVAEACGTRAIADFRELLGQVEAVSIAVPTSAHLAVASEFLTDRVPVLVEKPLAANLDEAEQLVELSDRHNTLLQVGHIERFNPATEVAWKQCGPPKYVRAERISPYTFRSTDIGVVHDLMIHDLDLILDLVRSPVERIDAFGISVMGEHEDSVQARLVFENGCIADLTASRVSPVPSRSMQIWSHRGCVTVDFTSRDVVCYSPSETLLYGTSPLERARQPEADLEQLKQDVFGKFLKVRRPTVLQSDALTAELSSFIECVQADRRPLVDGHQALEAMQIADDVLRKVAAHQWDGRADGAVGPFVRQPGVRRLAG